MGFSIPVGKWLRYELNDYLRSILLSQKHLNRGYFNKNYILQLIDEHSKGKYNHGDRLWALLVLEIWHRVYMD